MKKPERATRITRRGLFQTSAVVAGAAAVARWGGVLAFPRMAGAQGPYLPSNNNVVFVNNCQSLQNLTVSLQATNDLITLGNTGFSLQLVCDPQTHPPSIHLGKPLSSMQYVMAVTNNVVVWGIQYFSAVRVPPGVKGFGFNSPYNYILPFAHAPLNQVPAGSVMKIALETKANGNVTKATFSIQRVPGVAFSFTGPKGKLYHYSFPLPSNAQFAIYGFQVNLVGPPAHTCKFTSAGGFLNYSVSSGTLRVAAGRLPVPLGAQNTITCGGTQPITSETSNVQYGQPLTTSGNPMGQELSPIPP